ncbi:MAG: UbiA family prenyltransferase [Planctomycetaceae bacterium]|nr:UbiA family prenyltransferase [Planctomycetaceae bacterium]
MTLIRPFLQLCRLPAVFTAMADIFLGYLLVHVALVSVREESPADFLLLLGTSAALYLSGMVWNDVFDRHVDAVERPNRPIPSGRVSVRAAVIFGSALMLTGLICAGFVGQKTLIVAGLLSACIMGYDGGLKRTILGPVAMGGCRFLNVILGASSDWLRFEQVWWRPQLWVAAGLGVYIVGVTWFARTEARQSSRVHLSLATVVVNLGLAMLIGWMTLAPNPAVTPALFVLAVIGLSINRRLLVAIADPSPQPVQTAIKTMLLSVIMLDATLVFAKLGQPGAGYAIATASLIIPAMMLGRWLRLT